MLLRRLDGPDLAQARALGAEAFGFPLGPDAPPPETELRPGLRGWAWFDEERMVARIETLELQSWYGGQRVATAGVAGVSVEPERRGQGLLRELVGEALREARGRGVPLSTLYPTAPGIYRGLGYELISSYDTVEVATAELARVGSPGAVTTRRATDADLPALTRVLNAWASAQNGPLTRTAPTFRRTLLERPGVVSLAQDADGAVVGFAAWERTGGFGADGRVEVRDLVATSAEAYRALWALVASFAPVAPTTRVITSGADPARLVLGTARWEVVERHSYMARVLDLPALVDALAPRLPGGGTAAVDLTVTGDRLGLVEGGFRLELGETSRCVPQDRPGEVVLSVQGLSLLVTGAQDCANLRLLGHLSGPTTADAALDAAFTGRPLHVRDFF